MTFKSTFKCAQSWFNNALYWNLIYKSQESFFFMYPYKTVKYIFIVLTAICLLHVKLRYQSKLNYGVSTLPFFCILEFIFPFIVCKILVSDDARETGGGERFGEGRQLRDTP